jgi:hypothetical protein
LQKQQRAKEHVQLEFREIKRYASNKELLLLLLVYNLPV